MDKRDAVLFLMTESRRDTGTRSRMLRTEKALKALGLDPFERGYILAHLDYYETPQGPPFAK